MQYPIGNYTNYVESVYNIPFYYFWTQSAIVASVIGMYIYIYNMYQVHTRERYALT